MKTQAISIYRKFGVTSRRETIARMHGSGSSRTCDAPPTGVPKPDDMGDLDSVSMSDHETTFSGPTSTGSGTPAGDIGSFQSQNVKADHHRSNDPLTSAHDRRRDPD